MLPLRGGIFAALELPTADWRLPTGYCRLETAYCLLNTATCPPAALTGRDLRGAPTAPRYLTNVILPTPKLVDKFVYCITSEGENYQLKSFMLEFSPFYLLKLRRQSLS
jgi:hypothetical protein